MAVGCYYIYRLDFTNGQALALFPGFYGFKSIVAPL